MIGGPTKPHIVDLRSDARQTPYLGFLGKPDLDFTEQSDA
jgi:hypothetical protein